MATAYSGEVAVGTYNRIRLRVEYSGTSAHCYMEFRRTSSYTGSWGDTQASISFNGTTQSAPYYYSGTVGTSWVQLCDAGGFSVHIGGGTLGWSFNNPGGSSVLGCSGTIDIPSQISPPTGLSFTGCTAGPDWYDVGVSVSGWGNGGSAGQRYIEANIAQRNDSTVDTNNRRFQKAYGVTSSTIRVTNSSEQLGGFNIIPNTINTVGIYATNGAADTGMIRVGNHCSAPPEMVTSSTAVTTDSASLSWSFGNQGGAFPLLVQYSLDGTNWTTASTETGSGSKSGSYVITGLSAGTTYSIRTRVLSESTYPYNSTDGNTVSITTTTSGVFYGSVNGQTKKITKLYGSVNGQTKLITKLYGSVNGVTKRIFQEGGAMGCGGKKKK